MIIIVVRSIRADVITISSKTAGAAISTASGTIITWTCVILVLLVNEADYSLTHYYIDITMRYLFGIIEFMCKCKRAHVNVMQI